MPSASKPVADYAAPSAACIERFMPRRTRRSGRVRLRQPSEYTVTRIVVSKGDEGEGRWFWSARSCEDRPLAYGHVETVDHDAIVAACEEQGAYVAPDAEFVQG